MSHHSYAVVQTAAPQGAALLGPAIIAAPDR